MITEIVYTWSGGREEVRYRRPKDSAEALKFVSQVLDLQRKHGDACPYSFRHVEGEARSDARPTLATTTDAEGNAVWDHWLVDEVAT